MNVAARLGLSALVASIVPAVPFVVISLLVAGDPSSAWAAVITWSVSAAHVVALGIPAFILLQRKRAANRWSLLLAGFVLGFIPITLLYLPNMLRGYSFNFSTSLLFGVLGAFSAWVFFLVWSRLGPNNSFKPNPLRRFVG